MATSEQTFADRLGRAETLSAAISTASPAFAPADETLSAANFADFLSDLDTLNDEANSAEDTFSTAVRNRKAIVIDVKARALRAFRYVLSNKAWASHAGSIKLTYDKLRNNKPRPTKLPTTGTEGEIKKAIKTGEQSYADLDSLFSKFVVGLSKIAGYAPPAPELGLATLQGLSGDFSTKNKTMAGLAESASVLVRDRQTGFRDLKTKTKAIKNAVSSQYGLKSATYLAIKGLRF